MSHAENFISRLPSGAPPHLPADISVAFGIADGFKKKAASIRSDPTLTRIGADAAIERALKAGPLDHLSQLRRGVEESLAKARGQRENLRQRVLGAETYPEGRKQEVRQWLRSLDDNARRRAVLESKDALILEAVVGAPGYLSGLTDDVWQHVTNAAVEAAHGEHLKQIDVLESAFTEASAAMQIATDELRRASGLDANEFGKLAG